MAAQAVAWRLDRERREGARDAILREHADLRQQAAAIAHRNERAEQMRELRARQETVALRFDAEVAAEFARLASLLQAAAAEPARDLAQIRQAVPIERAPTVEDVAAPPRPHSLQYAPAPPGLFGRRRYDRAIVAARAELDAALVRHDEALAIGLAELIRQHEHRAARLRRAHEAEWDAIAAGVAAGDPDAVGTRAVASLQASGALRGLIEGGRTTYDAAARELVLEIDIPDTDVVPRERGWGATLSTAPRPCRLPRGPQRSPRSMPGSSLNSSSLSWTPASAPSDRTRSTSSPSTATSRQLIRQPEDRIIRASSPSPPTGPRSTSSTCAIRDSTRKARLRELGAELSPHPHDLEHINPIVDFDTAKYRIAYGPEALTKLDHRMDLLQMNPYEFERLVRDLFAQMGYDTWRTQSSRDDGIDAVATKSDPHMPVECIVQAKRYRGAVSPRDVQALMGAMAEKPTATHGYLVTTSWLSPYDRGSAPAACAFTPSNATSSPQ